MDWLLHNLLMVDQPGKWILALCVGVLLAGGFGLPMPEDVPLLAMGYLAYKNVAPLHWVLVLGLGAVLIGDSTIYWLGRKIGYRITQSWPFRRFLSPRRLARASDAFHAHGGKTLFIARFLPGLRTPVFFSAGLFKIPYWKMLVFDGSAAFISAPTLILAAYFAGLQIESVKTWTVRAQIGVALFILAIGGLVVTYKLMRRRRQASGAQSLK